jgi:hypothetical protein
VKRGFHLDCGRAYENRSRRKWKIFRSGKKGVNFADHWVEAATRKDSPRHECSKITLTETHTMNLICLCGALVLLAGCGQSLNQPQPAASMGAVRTDTGPIAKRLPNLGGLQSVWWTSTKVTKDSFLSPPGNPAYRVVGFAQLEEGKADEISQLFQWQRTSLDWKPSLTVTNLNLESAEWSQSPAFTIDCKPQQIPGQLFFERQKGIVYFDLEIE